MVMKTAFLPRSRVPKYAYSISMFSFDGLVVVTVVAAAVAVLGKPKGNTLPSLLPFPVPIAPTSLPCQDRMYRLVWKASWVRR